MFPPAGEESVEVVQTFASGGTSTKGESKYSLVRLYISSCLRAPWDPQAGTGEKDICNACLVCCHCDAISFRWMDGWKEIKQSHFVLTLQIPDIDFKMYPLLAEGILKLFYLVVATGPHFLSFPASFYSSTLSTKHWPVFFSKQNYSKVLGRGTWRANVAWWPERNLKSPTQSFSSLWLWTAITASKIQRLKKEHCWNEQSGPWYADEITF